MRGIYDTAVLLAVYNGENYIQDLLSSLKKQELSDFDIVVSDDGSSDATGKIIAHEILRSNIPTHSLIRPSTDERGAKGNFLFLIENTEAKTYFLCDQDDIWFSSKMKKEKERLDELRKKYGDDLPLLVFSDAEVTDSNLKVMSPSFLEMNGLSGERTDFRQILIDNVAPGCTMCFNRALREKYLSGRVKSYDSESLELIEMHDHYLLMIASVFGHVSFLNEPTLFYRQHEDNEVGAGGEGKAAKIGRNLSALLSGSFKKDKAEFIEKKKRLAWAMLCFEDIPDEAGKVLSGFLDMDRMKKSERMRFLKENNIGRNRHDLWFRLFA